MIETEEKVPLWTLTEGDWHSGVTFSMERFLLRVCALFEGVDTDKFWDGWEAFKSAVRGDRGMPHMLETDDGRCNEEKRGSDLAFAGFVEESKEPPDNEKLLPTVDKGELNCLMVWTVVGREEIGMWGILLAWLMAGWNSPEELKLDDKDEIWEASEAEIEWWNGTGDEVKEEDWDKKRKEDCCSRNGLLEDVLVIVECCRLEDTAVNDEESPFDWEVLVRKLLETQLELQFNAWLLGKFEGRVIKLLEWSLAEVVIFSLETEIGASTSEEISELVTAELWTEGTVCEESSPLRPQGALEIHEDVLGVL